MAKNSFKLRNLVESDNVDICWQDVLLLCVDLSGPLRELEYTSKKADLKDVKKKWREIKRQMKRFEGRINGELTDGIEKIHNLKKGSYKGNADALIKFRNSQ